MKKTFSILILTFFSLVLFAQNENDALRYSLINYGGTARFAGLSGAYGAVGADFTSLSQNPAGIGLYRKSEFSITPLLNNSSTQSNYLDTKNTDFRNTLYLGNVGYVMSIQLNENNGSHLKQLQFGFGMNRTAMFNNRIIIENKNNVNSLLLNYFNETDPKNPDLGNLDDYGSGLAYDVHLLYQDLQDTADVWRVDLPSGNLNQTVETRGGISETVLSAGTNFDDKLFLGLTFGFPRINYQQENVYSENDDNNSSPYVKSFQRTEYLNTKGNGFNFKFGFIFKPVDFIRIGGSVHTPTSYGNMNDSYGASMTAYYDQPPLTTSNATRFEATAKDGSFDYKITTPMRALGSLAVIIGQYGLISADYEYIDYSTARLRFSNAIDFDAMTASNNKIRIDFTSANNVRLGTEWKAGIYAFRGGYSLYGSPYKGESISGLGSRTGYSFGFGIHDKAYFIDFSYNHIDAKDNYYIYGYAPATQNKYSNNTYSFTLGFRL